MTLLICCAALSILPSLDLGQTAAVQASAIVETAVQAHGGMAAFQAIKDITREFDVMVTDPAQGLRPDTPATQKIKITSIRDVARQRYAEIVDTLPGDASPQHQITVFNGEAAFGASHTLKIVVKLPPPAIPPFRARAQRRQPEAMLLSAAARPEALRYLGEETFDGKTQRVVSFADSDGTAVTLFFDTASGLLTKLSIVSDDAVLGDTVTEVVFSEYAVENGVKLPRHYQERLGGKVLRDYRVTATHINTSPADSVFAIPQDYTVFANNPPAQGTQKMADNVYLVQGGYDAMFAVFPDYVVVLEGPQSNAVSDQVLREIQKVAPGKPVKYVVVTHFHHDHISGIRRWVAEGATLVCPPAARQAIERAVAAEHRLRPDALSRAPKSPVFEVFDPAKDKPRVFEGGGLRFEVRAFPTEHVAEMLVGYFPQTRLLYEADMLSVPPGGKLVPAPFTTDFAKRLADWASQGRPVEKIVAVHGGVTTMEDLNTLVGGAN